MNRLQTTSALRANRVTLAASTVALVFAVIALAGCGASIDTTLVKEAGAHGDALEKVYVLYNQDVLSKLTNRNLKDINAALKANDLKRATAGDLRRGQDEIRSRIDKLDKFVAKIKAAGRELKNTPAPNFADGLDSDFANKEFAGAYTDTTTLIQRYVTSDLAATKLVFTSFERYLDFLEQWEQFVTGNDTAGLVAAGAASDKAYSRVNAKIRSLRGRDSLSNRISPLVAKMASAASDSSQLTSLVDEMKKNHPKSFLAQHIVEKK